MSLTGAEWKLLHRVIDLVDQRRIGPAEGADVQRVKALVLDVYRDQGIGVDEAVIEQAIRDAAEPVDVAPNALVAIPTGAMGSLEKAEAQWQAVEKSRADAKRQAQMATNPLARLTARIDAESGPLIAHRPLTDAAIGSAMAQAMVRQVLAFRRLGRLAWVGWSASLVGVAIFVWQAQAIITGGGSVLAAAAGIMLAAAGGRGAWLARRQRAQTGAHTLTLMRGQKALALQNYDDTDLKKGAQIAGHIVRGSLKPLEPDQLDAAQRRVKSIAVDDDVVSVVWEGWDFSRAPMRENDFLVLQALRNLRRQHPFHSLKRLKELSQRRGRPGGIRH